MAIYDLSSPTTAINITEDVRGPATPVAGSPFTISGSPTTVLAANANRATATIINTGTAPVYLLEGTAPTVSSTVFTYILPSNRMWEPDNNFRYQGAIQAITASGASSTLAVSQSTITLL